MSTKRCLKCNHVTDFEGAPPLACPQCGAVYSKVEDALRNGSGLRPKPDSNGATAISSNPSQFRRSQFAGAQSEVQAFVKAMRGDSLYPAWRKIVGFVTVVGYITAVVVLVAGFATSKGSIWPIVVGMGIAALIALAAKVGKELSLMLADLSDATVRLAARGDGEQ